MEAAIRLGRESAWPGSRHREQEPPRPQVQLGVQQHSSWRLEDSRVTSARQKKLQDSTDTGCRKGMLGFILVVNFLGYKL